MRVMVILVCLLAALPVRAISPEVGKDRLRTLVKLPTLSFQADWTFDPESGFALGSGAEDTRSEIASVRKGLQHDTSDAERQQRLAELYAAANETTNSRNAWLRAAGYYRQRVELQPDDGALLAGFGLSLAGTGRTSEAESVLRRAVQTAPNEWKCRVALGRFLDSQARQSVLDRPPPDAAEMPSDRPPAADVSQAKKWLDEAGNSFDRAVALAPEQSEVFFRRGMHLCLETAALNQFRAADNGASTAPDPLEGCFSQVSLADLQHASRLAPNDYRLAGATALFEIYAVTVTKGRVDWDKFSWSSLPEKSQSSLRETLTRLENLAQNPDDHVAAGALEVLGILQGPILHEPNRCIATLQRVVALQPSRDQAWEVLVATLAQAGRYDELLNVCEAQVGRNDTARTHLMLAKAHEKLRQWEDCEDEARTAAGEDPDDVGAGLSLAALLLKRSRDDADLLSEADDLLSRSESALKKSPPGRRNRQQVIDLTLTRGIYFALTDEIETARQWVRTVIDRDKDNKFAREILSAMDF